MAIDVFTLIFEVLLKISPELISKYPALQDQLLYLILVPHVVLLLFLFAFGGGIVRNILGGPHPSFEFLLGIVGYLIVVLSGWYGTWLVPITVAWMYIILIVSFALFLVSVIITPARFASLSKAGKALGGKAYEATAGEAKKKEQVEKEIASLNKELTAVRSELSALTPGNPDWAYSKRHETMLLREIDKLKAQL